MLLIVTATSTWVPPKGPHIFECLPQSAGGLFRFMYGNWCDFKNHNFRQMAHVAYKTQIHTIQQALMEGPTVKEFWSLLVMARRSVQVSPSYYSSGFPNFMFLIFYHSLPHYHLLLSSFALFLQLQVPSNQCFWSSDFWYHTVWPMTQARSDLKLPPTSVTLGLKPRT